MTQVTMKKMLGWMMVMGLMLPQCKVRDSSLSEEKQGGKDTGGGWVVVSQVVDKMGVPIAGEKKYELFDLWYGSRKYDLNIVRDGKTEIAEQVKNGVKRIVKLDPARFRYLEDNVQTVMNAKLPLAVEVNPASDYPKEFKPLNGDILPLFAFTADGYILIQKERWESMLADALNDKKNEVRTDIAVAYIHEALRHVENVDAMETLAILSHTYSNMSDADLKTRYDEKFKSMVMRKSARQIEEEKRTFEIFEPFQTMKSCEIWIKDFNKQLMALNSEIFVAKSQCSKALAILGFEAETKIIPPSGYHFVTEQEPYPKGNAVASDDTFLLDSSKKKLIDVYYEVLERFRAEPNERPLSIKLAGRAKFQTRQFDNRGDELMRTRGKYVYEMYSYTTYLTLSKDLNKATPD